MTDPLSKLFLELKLSFANQKHWENAVFSALSDTKISEEIKESIYKELKDIDIHSTRDFQLYARKLLSYLILHKEKPSAKDNELLRRFYSNCSDSVQLHKAYQNFACSLTGKELVAMECLQLPSGLALAEEGKIQKKSFFYTLENINELASFWIILGSIYDNKNWQDAGLRLARWSLNYIDPYFRPFFGIWTQETDISQLNVLCSYYLLIYILKFFYEEESMAHIQKQIFSMIEAKIKKQASEQFVYYASMIMWLEKHFSIDFQTKMSLQTTFENIFVDPYSGFLRQNHRQLSTLFTLSGNNTGLGSIYAKDVLVYSFGPQFFPLGDSKSFGVQRRIFQENSLKDVQYSIDENSGKIEGCFSLFQKTPETIWASFKGSTSSDQCELSLKIIGQELKKALAMIYYVKAQSCEINGKSIKPNTLDQYIGSVQDLVFRGGESSLRFKAKAERMHLIPLSGGKCFWGADFLLAYEMKACPEYHAQISSV